MLAPLSSFSVRLWDLGPYLAYRQGSASLRQTAQLAADSLGTGVTHRVLLPHPFVVSSLPSSATSSPRPAVSSRSSSSQAVLLPKEIIAQHCAVALPTRRLFHSPQLTSSIDDAAQEVASLQAAGVTKVMVDAPCNPTVATLMYGQRLDVVEIALSQWMAEAQAAGLDVAVWLRGALACRWTANAHLTLDIADRVAHHIRCGASMVVLEEATPLLTARRLETIVKTVAAHGLHPDCLGFSLASNDEVTESVVERALQHQGLDFFVTSFGCHDDHIEEKPGASAVARGSRVPEPASKGEADDKGAQQAGQQLRTSSSTHTDQPKRTATKKSTSTTDLLDEVSPRAPIDMVWSYLVQQQLEEAAQQHGGAAQEELLESVEDVRHLVADWRAVSLPDLN